MVRCSAAVLAMLLLVACGRFTGSEPVAGPTTVAPTPGDSESVAELVCEVGGARLLSSIVEVHTDGVHVVIDNRSGRNLGFAYEGAYLTGGGGGADRGKTRLVLDLPPGPAKLRCVGPGQDAGWETLQVVDPGGTWTSRELDCRTPRYGGDYAVAPKSDPREPMVVARDYLDPRPEDEVVPAGYPEAETRTFVLVRDGRRIARVDLLDASLAGGEAAGGWIKENLVSCGQ